MPTFIAFKNGAELERVVGAAPQQLEVRCPPLYTYTILDY